MYCQLAFSGDAFKRLIKYRIADLFRPPVKTVEQPKGVQSWIDGMLVNGIELVRLTDEQFAPLNERWPDGGIRPNILGRGYEAGGLSVELGVDVFLAEESAVANAGLGQPPVQTLSIGRGPLTLLVRASVGPDGVPLLRMDLDRVKIAGLGLPPEILDGLRAVGNASFPLDIGGQLKDILPPGNDKVLNAGITRDDRGAVVLRFELPYQLSDSLSDRIHEWDVFFSAALDVHLDDADWRIDLDGGAVAVGLAAAIDGEFKNDPPVFFDGSPVTDFFDGDPARVRIRKHGYIENACAGNDLGFDAFTYLDLSVPSENLLRGAVGFTMEKDDVDTATCIIVDLLNPLSVFLTALDHGEGGLGAAELALSFVFPTKAFIALGAITMMITGMDKTIAQHVIDGKLKESAKVTKLPDGGFAMDRKMDSVNALTRDWLVLTHCAGSNGRLLLQGALRVPDPVLPRLDASDLEGMGDWLLSDRCDPGKGQRTEGSLALTLSPGHGAEAASVQPVRFPTIPLKWGRRPDGGELVFDVVNDDLGIYQYRFSLYQEVFVPGIPGVVEVQLDAHRLREQPKFEPFATKPYPLRLRFYTNAGIREYEFAAPPKFRQFQESVQDAVIRINNCKHRGSSLVLHRYLSLLWLGSPADDHGGVTHEWEVHLSGLAAGRAATVWNQDTGAPLVRAFADRAGRIDVSLVLRDGEHADALLIGLDDNPFVSARQLRRIIADSEDAPRSQAEVSVRQTTLVEVEDISFDEAIVALSLDENGRSSVLTVETASGERIAHALPSPYNAGLATRSAELAEVSSRGAHAPSERLAWRGGRRQFTLLSRRRERPEVLAEYSARSTLDLGAARQDLFAQVSDDGLRVTLYHRSVPILLGTHEWREHEPVGADGAGVVYEGNADHRETSRA